MAQTGPSSVPLGPLPTSHLLPHHQQWGFPSHWTELCYTAQNSSVVLMGTEQIIAVSAEIISCETGRSHGEVPCAPCSRAWEGSPAVPVDASLSSRSALYNLSQVNTKVTGVILTIAWHHCWQTRDHNGCSWKNPHKRLQWTAELRTDKNNSDKHVAQTRSYCKGICWAPGTPPPLSHQVQSSSVMGTPPPSQPAGRAQSCESSQQMFNISIPHCVSPGDRDGQGRSASWQLSQSLCSYQVEQGKSCSRQTMRWLYPEWHCSALQAGTRGSYRLSWERRQSRPRGKGYKIFWTQKPRIVQQSLPLNWNSGLFCQERSALNI